MKKITLWLIVLFYFYLSGYSQKVEIVSDYELTDKVEFRNLVNFDSSSYGPYGQGVYCYYDKLGRKIIITEAECSRKTSLGVRTVDFFLDSCKNAGLRFDTSHYWVEIDKSSFLPGKMDSSLLKSGPLKDSITHNPFDERVKMYWDSLNQSIPRGLCPEVTMQGRVWETIGFPI